MKTLTRVRVSCYLTFFQQLFSGRFLSDSQTNWECHVFENHADMVSTSPYAARLLQGIQYIINQRSIV